MTRTGRTMTVLAARSQDALQVGFVPREFARFDGTLEDRTTSGLHSGNCSVGTTM